MVIANNPPSVHDLSLVAQRYGMPNFTGNWFDEFDTAAVLYAVNCWVSNEGYKRILIEEEEVTVTLVRTPKSAKSHPDTLHGRGTAKSELEAVLRAFIAAQGEGM